MFNSSVKSSNFQLKSMKNHEIHSCHVNLLEWCTASPVFV